MVYIQRRVTLVPYDLLQGLEINLRYKVLYNRYEYYNLCRFTLCFNKNSKYRFYFWNITGDGFLGRGLLIYPRLVLQCRVTESATGGPNFQCICFLFFFLFPETEKVVNTSEFLNICTLVIIAACNRASGFLFLCPKLADTAAFIWYKTFSSAQAGLRYFTPSWYLYASCALRFIC